MPSEATRVAVVGQGDVVLPLRAAGLDVFTLKPGGDARQLVEKLINQGYQLIYFTDDLAEQLKPLIARLRTVALPSLVALPFTGQTGAEDQLRDAVRRAVGADILSSKTA
ncbi:MAG: V-type ATP synthase subunit F [bacterium]